MGSVFPAGGVYFRKSNPPPADWAKDHKTASQIGMNTFRHWLMWSAVEVAPGKWDWADYDQMMDLAALNGIKVILATLDTMEREESRLLRIREGRVAASSRFNSGFLFGLVALNLAFAFVMLALFRRLARMQGLVTVYGDVETRRGRQLVVGDVVSLAGAEARVARA